MAAEACERTIARIRYESWRRTRLSSLELQIEQAKKHAVAEKDREKRLHRYDDLFVDVGVHR